MKTNCYEVEWKRTNPDLVVYKPSGIGRDDDFNIHFLVKETPGGDWLATWTMGGEEGYSDQRMVVARSSDRGKTWSRPLVVAGPEHDGDGIVACYGFPIMVPETGRIYMFYLKSIDPQEDRGDVNGAMYAKWSDDDGHTWSKEAVDIPIADAEYDGPRPRHTKNWIVWQLPMITSWGDVMVGYTRWTMKGWDTRFNEKAAAYDHPMMAGECSFFRFDNVLSESDPSKLRTTTLPRGGRGLRAAYWFKPSPTGVEPSGIEEPSIVELSDGRLFCTMRTSCGMIYHSISSDRGETWTSPRPLLYRPGGRVILNPLAPCPIYKMRDGRYLLLFYNNDGTANGSWPTVDSDRNRNPLYVTVGREGTGDPDCPLIFGRPKMFANNDLVPIGDRSSHMGAGYTSFIDDGNDRILFYPDRMHFLLGKYLTDEWLKDCDPLA